MEGVSIQDDHIPEKQPCSKCRTDGVVCVPLYDSVPDPEAVLEGGPGAAAGHMLADPDDSHAGQCTVPICLLLSSDASGGWNHIFYEKGEFVVYENRKT